MKISMFLKKMLGNSFINKHRFKMKNVGLKW